MRPTAWIQEGAREKLGLMGEKSHIEGLFQRPVALGTTYQELFSDG